MWQDLQVTDLLVTTARYQVAKAEKKEQSTENEAEKNILGEPSASSYHCPPAGRRTEPPEFVAFNLMALARQTFGEGFKLSNYFSFKNAQKSHLETILSCTELKYSSGQKQKFFWAPPVTHRSSFVEVFFHGQEFCSEHQTIRLTESEDQFDKLKKLESRSLQQCDNT